MNSDPSRAAKSTPTACPPNAAIKSVAATDSPWFWLSIFILGALLALLLTAPKYRWRQPQIERQFQARERSGHVVSPYGGNSPLSTPGHALLTLRPLFAFFCVALLLSTIAFWWRKLAAVRHAHGREQQILGSATKPGEGADGHFS